MEELLRTTDPTLIPFATALLKAEDIDCFALDINMSVLEGSIGVLPRRLMVHREDLHRARIILRDNGVEPYERESWL
ncbi:MAG: DUF2007 domain-containing protein [Pseudomonadota bacterium]